MPGGARIHLKIITFATAFILAAALLSGVVEGQTAFRCPGDMALVPGGKFLHGTDKNILNYIIVLCRETFDYCSSGWFENEFPRKVRDLKKFCIDKYEYPNQAGKTPMYAVSWDVANKLCISQGKRLCTEKEWEKACAGPYGRIWPFGDTFMEGYCNIYGGGMSSAGSNPMCKSPYGAYDMTGNLSEWTASTMTVDYASPKNRKLPRFVKGGSHKDHPVYSRCAFTDSSMPDYVSETVGFRCCWPGVYKDDKKNIIK